MKKKDKEESINSDSELVIEKKEKRVKIRRNRKSLDTSGNSTDPEMKTKDSRVKDPGGSLDSASKVWDLDTLSIQDNTPGTSARRKISLVSTFGPQNGLVLKSADILPEPPKKSGDSKTDPSPTLGNLGDSETAAGVPPVIATFIMSDFKRKYIVGDRNKKTVMVGQNKMSHDAMFWIEPVTDPGYNYLMGVEQSHTDLSISDTTESYNTVRRGNSVLCSPVNQNKQLVSLRHVMTGAYLTVLYKDVNNGSSRATNERESTSLGTSEPYPDANNNEGANVNNDEKDSEVEVSLKYRNEAAPFYRRFIMYKLVSKHANLSGTMGTSPPPADSNTLFSFSSTSQASSFDPSFANIPYLFKFIPPPNTNSPSSPRPTPQWLSVTKSKDSYLKLRPTNSPLKPSELFWFKPTFPHLISLFCPALSSYLSLSPLAIHALSPAPHLPFTSLIIQLSESKFSSGVHLRTSTGGYLIVSEYDAVKIAEEPMMWKIRKTADGKYRLKGKSKWLSVGENGEVKMVDKEDKGDLWEIVGGCGVERWVYWSSELSGELAERYNFPLNSQYMSLTSVLGARKL